MYGVEKPPESEPGRQYYYIGKLREYLAEKSAKAAKPYSFCVVTFGCQMNFRDSEKLSGILKAIGYIPQPDEKKADFVIFNTCTVRENADLRVYGRIGQLKKAKGQNPDMLIAICGCMMQRPSAVKKITQSYGFVDIIFGTHNIYKLAELIWQRLESGRRVTDILTGTGKIVEELPNDRKYFFKAGVNVMYGCDNFCSYCIVPYVRGREKSRKPEDIVREIRALTADGVVEVMLLGQNVNSYGKNLEKPCDFAGLLQRVEKIEGLRRIRFMTSHPKDLSDALIGVMAESEKICAHLHLPLQSGSTKILKKMNRGYTKEDYLRLVEKVRSAVPQIALTTDIIVGFPGETEEDFQETMDVVREVCFSGAYTFIYSKRAGTPAANMEGQVPYDVAEERFGRLLKEVRTVSAGVCAVHTGKIEEALVEGINKYGSHLVTGRLGSNILVHFPGDVSLVGKIVSVKLLECKGFYYMGEMI